MKKEDQNGMTHSCLPLLEEMYVVNKCSSERKIDMLLDIVSSLQASIKNLSDKIDKLADIKFVPKRRG